MPHLFAMIVFLLFLGRKKKVIMAPGQIKKLKNLSCDSCNIYTLKPKKHFFRSCKLRLQHKLMQEMIGNIPIDKLNPGKAHSLAQRPTGVVWSGLCH